MANLKNITELPVAESAEGLNLIVNDNGAAKQIAASAVGAQADWTETDDSSPAFIKNKPIEELDFDIEVTILPADSEGCRPHSYTINHINTYANIKNKMVNGENLKYKVKFIEHESDDVYWYLNIMPQVDYCVENDLEFIGFGFVGYTGLVVQLYLNPDDTVEDGT